MACCKMMLIYRGIMILFAVSIFLSAFLLFQIQPMIGKFILPWFGGTPAVWSTLMLFFQVLLTGGYAYANWLIGRIKRQSLIHIPLLSLTVVVLCQRGIFASSPIMPSIPESLQSIRSPIFEIIKLLLFSIGLPFFVLASNGPLMQAWFSRIYPTQSYTRLYALSNVGSLLGLLAYPVLIEPNYSLRSQGWLWFIGFLCFALLMGSIVLKTGRAAIPLKPTVDPVKRSGRPPFSVLSLWIALSATASVFLLSITNQISQEVAVIPFLWILPLTIYLLSFILTFSGDRGYNRKFYVFLFVLSAALILYVMLNATSLHIYWQIFGLFFAAFRGMYALPWRVIFIATRRRAPYDLLFDGFHWRRVRRDFCQLDRSHNFQWILGILRCFGDDHRNFVDNSSCQIVCHAE